MGNTLNLDAMKRKEIPVDGFTDDNGLGNVLLPMHPLAVILIESVWRATRATKVSVSGKIKGIVISRTQC